MSLKTQRRLAAQILKVGENKIWLDDQRLDEIKEAITKNDVRSLIRDLAIQAKPEKGVSRYRARKKIKQRRKGRKPGKGSRKGKKTSRLPRKEAWVIKVRCQRKFLSGLREKLSKKDYRAVYAKIKGGFFRSKRHVKLYITENKLIK